ncbi:AsnC family transcriptional regulator [Streptomyces sp. NBC_00669]|uniref:Lrp/AsnC family transcriptional regulator n=1 Tax=Streptomyces sp. NBC_00669 TaxID=2976011 RepID=UPI002E35BC48|nr:AsnC family transcriptional regulator [Streptomyces sp. NBC_00669]
MEIATLDTVDRQILHALVVEPRIAFRTLAELVGVSDQTAARRYRRLRESAGLRVLGRVNGERVGWTDWLVRLRCTPGSTGAIAAALTRRVDTRWVQLASGGTEVVCVVQARTAEQRDALFLEGIPNSRRVVHISAHSLLRTFSSPTWPVFTSALTDAQLDRLPPPIARERDDTVLALDADDEQLLSHLAHDGRTSTAQLAAATGWHESSVRRRISGLCDSGVLYFDLDLDEHALGMTSNSLLWISARPDRLDETARAVARHPEAPFVAAVTGSSNLVANVVCRNERHLYDYLSGTLGRLPGIRAIETAPLIRTVKRAGSVLRPNAT